MTVKGDPGHKRTQAERRATTRAALLGAARELFADKGFAATGREEIVERAGVTRGALYHHFASKEVLFRAVYEQLETELMDAIVVAAVAATDPVEQLRLGARAFLDAAADDPAVRRVVLLDAPSVLSADVRHELSQTYGLGVTVEVLEHAMAAGRIARQPVDVLAPIVLAALHQAAELVADGKDRNDVGAIVDRMIEGL
jgi:AcrR family transcriptional regulator